MKKLGAEFILGVMFIPWAVYITVAIFDSQKAEAILSTKYDTILENLKDIKDNITAIKQNFK